MTISDPNKNGNHEKIFACDGGDDVELNTTSTTLNVIARLIR